MFFSRRHCEGVTNNRTPRAVGSPLPGAPGLAGGRGPLKGLREMHKKLSKVLVCSFHPVSDFEKFQRAVVCAFDAQAYAL